MQKTKEFKIPKYLRLNKGVMWFDTDGPNASGVKLIRSNFKFIGRGSPKTEEELTSADIELPIPNDKFKNENEIHGEYGYVDIEEDNSWFDVSKIDNSKLSRVIQAYKDGILIEHDPKKSYDTVAGFTQNKTFTPNKDGDLVFTGKNKAAYSQLQKVTYDKLVSFVTTCNDRVYLQDMYEYEMAGYNPISRPRIEIIDLIRKKINELGPGMSPLSKNED